MQYEVVIIDIINKPWRIATIVSSWIEFPWASSNFLMILKPPSGNALPWEKERIHLASWKGCTYFGFPTYHQCFSSSGQYAYIKMVLQLQVPNHNIPRHTANSFWVLAFLSKTTYTVYIGDKSQNLKTKRQIYYCKHYV